MTHYTPLKAHRKRHAETFRLQPSVIEFDSGRRIFRRHRTLRELAFDVLITWGLPACALLFVVLCLIGIYWLGWAIDRAVHSMEGGGGF